LAPATIDKRLSTVRRFVAVVDWRSASALDVEVWAGAQSWAPTSVRDGVSHVRAFYRWAIRAGLVDGDPTSAVELPRVRARLPRPARDVAIRVAVMAAGPSMRAMLALMAGVGLRCCEVAGLRWSDVDLVGGRVHVVGKGNRERVLVLPATVRRALAAVDGPGLFVFETVSGRPLTGCRVSQLVNAHLRRCAAGCTAHQLRHRFATRALDVGGSLHTVRDLLGHTSVATTEVYAAVAGGQAGRVGVAVDVPGLD
jgi:site-specific recombinase XerD